MTIGGVDYSGRVSGADLKAAGVVFAARYLNPNHTKTLQADEAQDLHAHGIKIVALCETTGGFLLTGRNAVRSIVSDCLTYADSIGVPIRALYCTADEDVPASLFPAMDDGLFGAAIALGRPRVGIYGDAAVIRHCQAAGSASWFMQSYAWSHGEKLSDVHMYQTMNQRTIAGTLCDIDEAYRPDYGQWPGPDPLPHTITTKGPKLIVYAHNPQTNGRDYGILSLTTLTIKHLQDMKTADNLGAVLGVEEIGRDDWDALLAS